MNVFVPICFFFGIQKSLKYCKFSRKWKFEGVLWRTIALELLFERIFRPSEFDFGWFPSPQNPFFDPRIEFRETCVNHFRWSTYFDDQGDDKQINWEDLIMCLAIWEVSKRRGLLNCGDLRMGLWKCIALIVVVDLFSRVGWTAGRFLSPLLQSAPTGHSCIPSVQALPSEHIQLTDEFRPILRSWMYFAGFLIVLGIPICRHQRAAVFHRFSSTHAWWIAPTHIKDIIRKVWNCAV